MVISKLLSQNWQNYQGGDNKRGEGGLINVKKQFDFQFILGDLKNFHTMFFPLRVAEKFNSFFETVP